MNRVEVAKDSLVVTDTYGGLHRLKPCPKHKQYRGVGMPRTDCHHCWAMFLRKHKVITTKALGSIPKNFDHGMIETIYED